MKIDAVEVTTSDMKRTVAFYRLLGFEFPEIEEDEDHMEPKTSDGSARLMIDAQKMMTEMLGEAPRPGNHGSFAVQYASPSEIDAEAKKVKDARLQTAQGTLGRILGGSATQWYRIQMAIKSICTLNSNGVRCPK